MSGFTWLDYKTICGPHSLVPSDDGTSIPLWQHLGMTQNDVAIAEMEILRDERNLRLKETDWVSGEDVPQNIKDVWFPYRQALRDITETHTSLENVIWPEKP